MEKLFIECKYFFEIDTPYEKQYMNISNDEFQLFTENKQKWWKHSNWIKTSQICNLKYEKGMEVRNPSIYRKVLQENYTCIILESADY